MNKNLSGEGIVRILNNCLIIVNGELMVQRVAYVSRTDDIALVFPTSTDILFPRHAFEDAGFDQDEDGNSFYVVLDGAGCAHNLAFYKNKSVEVIQDIDTYY